MLTLSSTKVTVTPPLGLLFSRLGNATEDSYSASLQVCLVL